MIKKQEILSLSEKFPKEDLEMLKKRIAGKELFDLLDIYKIFMPWQYALFFSEEEQKPLSSTEVPDEDPIYEKLGYFHKGYLAVEDKRLKIYLKGNNNENN